VMVMMAAGTVAAIAFLGVARLTGRPGRPGAPEAVGGAGTVVAGEDLQGRAVARQRIWIGQ
jgi:hypothetical protein